MLKRDQGHSLPCRTPGVTWNRGWPLCSTYSVTSAPALSHLSSCIMFVLTNFLVSQLTLGTAEKHQDAARERGPCDGLVFCAACRMPNQLCCVHKHHVVHYLLIRLLLGEHPGWAYPLLPS